MKQATTFSTAFARSYAVYHTSMVFAYCYIVSIKAYSAAELLGFTLTAGLLGGGAFNMSHELIHRRSRVDAALATLLLCSVSYPSFQIEHVAHHHKWVATDADPSSAKVGTSLYTHIPRAIALNIVNSARGAFRRSSSIGWKNEFVRSSAVLAAFYAAVFFGLGAKATLFFFGQSLVAISWLEIANYFQHYGLRRKVVDGRPEPVMECHSWDVDQPVLNQLWLNLPLHSHHHTNPAVSFDQLRLGRTSPKYPFGYVTCTILAMVPPLWTWFAGRLLHAEGDRE